MTTQKRWDLILLLLILVTMTHCTTSPSSSPAPIRSHDESPSTKVQYLMQHMTLSQKLGQLLLVEYIGNDYQASGLHEMVHDQGIGGILFQPVNHNFDAPTNTVEAAHAFTAQAQADAAIPLLTAVDQEGGLVSKLQQFFGPSQSAAELATTNDPQKAQAQGAQTARWMKAVGMTTDLAPVVDVQSANPPLLQSRMFGKDPQTVTTYAGAYLDGLQQNGIMGTLKHFPGLGSLTTDQDPHDALYTLNRTLPDLQNVDLAPYKELIQHNHPAMIMATDILVPPLDPTLPAELSPKVVNDLLRHTLGYQGVVVTDGLYMKGIASHWTLAQAAVLAIAAGDDLIEGPYTPDQVTDVLTAFKAALQDGRLTQSRIDEAVQRILLLKMQYGLISEKG